MGKFDHFNLISPIYDWVFGRSANLRIREWIELEPHHRLLDVGGGTGRVTVRFLSTTPKAFVVDSALKMLQKAQLKGVPAINAHSEALPFQSKAFDRIIMVDAFHHVADQQLTLDEIWRLLAPGGRLIIEEPDIRHGAVKLIALGEKLLLMRSQFQKPKDILAMCNYEDVENTHQFSEKGIAWVIIEKNSHGGS